MHSYAAITSCAGGPQTRDPWAIALLALAAACVYLLLYPYLGLTHDARLYTLQALNHLQPELYSNDIFLRFGSQDDYTIFTALYGQTIAHLGVEPAAALLTAISHAAFLACAALLARSIMPPVQAVVALFLLVALPSHYGSMKVFSYLEGFVTPRTLAEGTVLFGITTWLRGWRAASAVLLACAMLIHPIIGLAGPAFVTCLTLILPHRRKLWPLVPAGLLLAIVVDQAGLIPSQWLLDEEWRDIVLGRAEYLYLARWSADDWGRVATVGATLAIAARSLQPALQRISATALISTGALLFLALVGGDFLNLSLVVQAQPWRGLWLASVIAALLLPTLLERNWRDGAMGRCTVLLLLAAWLCPSENLALLISLLAVAAAACSPFRFPEHQKRLLLAGAHFAFGLVLIDALAVSLLSLRAGNYNVSVSPVLDALRGVSSGGTLPLLALAGFWWATRNAASSKVVIATVTFAALTASTAVATASTWLSTRYDADLKAAFAPWRALIPPGSDVMWAADTVLGAEGAVSSWILLERPSFVSRIQATTSLFSRPAALEIHSRTRSVLGVLPEIQMLHPKGAAIKVPGKPSLERVCRTTPVRYVVTTATFIDADPIPAPPHVRNPYRNLKLYICP